MVLTVQREYGGANVVLVSCC